MTDVEKDSICQLSLAPYIQKATALIGKSRKGGGNMFRHCFYVLGTLIDYHYTDPILLKAAIIHDLLEDFSDVNIDEIRTLDEHGTEVLFLVEEVSKQVHESKEEFLGRISVASTNAKILKCADRISNLVDLNVFSFGLDRTKRTLQQTEIFILPLAFEVNKDMLKELNDLIDIKKSIIDFYETKGL